MSARKEGFGPIIKRAISAFTGNFLILLFPMLLLSILDAALFEFLLQQTGAKDLAAIQNLGAQGKQSQLISFVLGYTGMGLLKSILIGPFVAAIVVYVSKNHVKQSKSSIYGAINFALNRYPRLFLPYLIAQLSIQLGNIIIIPGILFMMQYAFVDAIACLENEKHVISRSVKLTRGRRKYIFFIILPWAIVTQVFGILTLGAADSFVKLAGFNVLLEGLIMFMYMTFFMLYDQRIRQIQEIREERKQKALQEENNSTDALSEESNKELEKEEVSLKK